MRYLNMVPGETDKLSYQNQDWTHDVIVEMKIEEIIFRGSHPVREGDTITYYGLEQGRIDYHEKHEASGLGTIGDYLDPNDYDQVRRAIIRSRPRFIVGNRYYVNLYSTSFFMKGEDAFSVTVRQIAEYMSGDTPYFFQYITDMYRTGLSFLGKEDLDDDSVTPEDFETIDYHYERMLSWLRGEFDQAR